MKITVQKETTNPVVANVQETASQVHPLKKHHYVVSKKSVDYDNLTAFEAVSMSAVFVMAIVTGVVLGVPIS